MNSVILCGRLTRDPEIRYTSTANPMAIAHYNLAVDRGRFKDRNGGPTADFVPCVTFGKNAEFAQRYLQRGIKIIVRGRLQTGSYTDKDGRKVFTMEVVVDEHEFSESKAANAPSARSVAADAIDTSSLDFISIPEGLEDTGLPFE